MKFDHLVLTIEQTSSGLKQQALTSVNQALVIRNWIVGYYLVEYEQKGEDRAEYGEKLLESIANELKKKKIKGMSVVNLRIFRRFYDIYPQISQPVADQLQIQQPLAVEFKSGKSQALPDQLAKPIHRPLADEVQNSPRSAALSLFF